MNESAPSAIHTEARSPGFLDGVVYLDYNATTPVDPRVVDAILPYLSVNFGNPSSAHRYADLPRRALAAARARVAALIGAQDEEIVFTGSGSEADALAIQGVVLAQAGRAATRPHIVTQRSEHPAVLAACRSLQQLREVDVTYLPVDATGRVEAHALADAITDRTVLVTIMYANNETGTIQAIAELAKIAHEHGALFHTDAAQAVAKLPIDVRQIGVDLLTIVGHKMYAPKGIAALYVRDGTPLQPIVGGGGQERGLRAGTENVALAVGLGTAAELAAADLERGEPDRLRGLRDQLHSELASALPGRVLLNGHPTQRLPNTANLSFIGTHGDDLLAAVPELAASTGSACHSGRAEPSPVLTAMAEADLESGIAFERAYSAIRISLGRWTSEDEIRIAASRLVAAANTALG